MLRSILIALSKLWASEFFAIYIIIKKMFETFIRKMFKTFIKKNIQHFYKKKYSTFLSKRMFKIRNYPIL